MKNFKRSQLIIFVIALMLVTAGYLNFTNQQNSNLIPTSSLADSEKMASIGDATLVNANQLTENETETNVAKDENLFNAQANMTQENMVQNNMMHENSSQNTNTIATAQTEIENNKADSYFAQSRLDRDNMYSQMLENYQKILETANITTEEKANAQSQIEKINNEKNAIMIAENLIKIKGFEDVILFVNNGNVSVIVKEEKLDETKVAQIQNIITRELNVEVTKINISNKL